MKRSLKRLAIRAMGKWILSNLEVSRGGMGFLLGAPFLFRVCLDDLAMDMLEEIGNF